MERGGPCDGLCRFRIHLGTRGDCPLPAGDGGILDGTDEAYSSENPPSDTYSNSGVGGK
uniref:Uncharacterized protein n=1 Tax=Oryza sativa subsp. japonica TaxID=39947 RepID=Q6ATE8_ORYSJ|nr:hypothetical protein [Oryza sativa Japonica Group]AAV31297.1 hypothetical protein [Oryza sativa Japonica Group]